MQSKADHSQSVAKQRMVTACRCVRWLQLFDVLYREQILSRAQELSETNAKLDVLPMIPQDQNFDMSFWSTVLQKTEEDQWEYKGAYIPDRLSVCSVTCTISMRMIYVPLPLLTTHLPFTPTFLPATVYTKLSISNAITSRL